MTDKTTDGTTSHLTNPAKDAGQVIGYSHSTRLPKDSKQVAGYNLKLLVALITGLAISAPATAKLFKWVDDNGTTHYGETVPPEFADKDRVELNKSGRVINSTEVMTPERRLVQQQEEAKRLKEETAAAEQKRYDHTLTSTYTSVEEIDLARHRSLQQLEARINFLNSYIKTADDNLLALQTESERYDKAGKKIPASLQEDLQDAQDRLTKLQHDMEKPLADKAALEARFEADKSRYIELTGRK